MKKKWWWWWWGWGCNDDEGRGGGGGHDDGDDDDDYDDDFCWVLCDFFKGWRKIQGLWCHDDDDSFSLNWTNKERKERKERKEKEKQRLIINPLSLLSTYTSSLSLSFTKGERERHYKEEWKLFVALSLSLNGEEIQIKENQY